MYILGLSAFYHDSAACLLKDGEIIVTAQEERLPNETRCRVPTLARQVCIKEAGISSRQIESVVFYEKPFVSLRDYEHILHLPLEDLPALPKRCPFG